MVDLKVEWLQHMRNSAQSVDPGQFTIDCCQAEVNTITNTFDRERSNIQLCVFHAVQAWNKHLASVSVAGNTVLQNCAVLFWQRDTYYKPPPGMASVLPKNLFACPPPQSILEKLNLVQQNNYNNSGVDDNEAEHGIDDNGWRKEGSQWYNVYTKSYYDSSPYDEEGC